MRMGELPLSGDRVASIKILGDGRLGDKSKNLFMKAGILEDCGFLFPRRNLVITADVLRDGLEHSGMKIAWHENGSSKAAMLHETEFRRKFGEWAKSEIWEQVESVFEGRALYVRSDLPGDALGRGVYVSVPFVNSHVEYGGEDERARVLSGKMLEVIASYFDLPGKHFRAKYQLTEEGINIFLSQFIGRVGEFRLGGKKDRALAPFLSAVVKTRIVSDKAEGIIRFEYGQGSGALMGKTIIVGEEGAETLMGKARVRGVDTSFSFAKPRVIPLSMLEEEVVESSNWPVVNMLMQSAYGLTRRMEDEAAGMIGWLVENIRRFEKCNGGPIYLELISSIFKQQNRMSWFVVQAADYSPSSPIARKPQEGCFISNADFSGHGIVEGKREIYVFGEDAFSDAAGMRMLHEINRLGRDYVVMLPQHALTGTNLTSLSASHFSNARAVIEYERLGQNDAPVRYHEPAHTSSEHFEQLALDFEILFMPIDAAFASGRPVGLEPKGVIKAQADVLLVCDRERGVAWGKIGPLEAAGPVL